MCRMSFVPKAGYQWSSAFVCGVLIYGLPVVIWILFLFVVLINLVLKVFTNFLQADLVSNIYF